MHSEASTLLTLVSLQMSVLLQGDILRIVTLAEMWVSVFFFLQKGLANNTLAMVFDYFSSRRATIRCTNRLEEPRLDHGYDYLPAIFLPLLAGHCYGHDCIFFEYFQLLDDGDQELR